MSPPIYVFDPTANDPLSKVRGIGRYLQILKENLPKETIFTNNLNSIIFDSIFINPFFNFLKRPLITKRIAKKQIAVIHDLIPFQYPKYFPIGIKGAITNYLNKISLKNYDSIITDSEQSKNIVIKMLSIDSSIVKVIYPTLPNVFWKLCRDRSRPTPTINNKTIGQFNNFVLYVGDATWNKNLVNLARAIKIINVPCVFVGKVFQPSPLPNQNLNNPWQHELKQFFEETKNDKRFVFTGYIPDQELIDLYKKAKVNILVSRDEGFGFSFVESASCKTPSVLSDTPIFHELAKDSALYAKTEDPNDIASKIGEIYFNDKLRNELGFKAQQRSKFFNQEGFKNEWKTLLK